MQKEITNITRHLMEFMPLYFRHINPIIHTEKSKNYTLNENQIKLIMVLTLKGPQNPSKLSLFINIPKGSLTTVIDSLVSKGLVERLNDKTDKRKLIIKLTKTGHKFSSYKTEKIIEDFNQLLKKTDKSNIAMIEKGLELLATGLNSLNKVR